MTPAARRTAVLSLALLAVLALPACGETRGSTASSQPSTAGGPTLTGQDAEALERWTQAAITDYRYRIEPQCECLGVPLLVEVRDGAVVGVRPSESPFADEVALAVPDLIGYVGSARRTDASVEVVYDAELGYPMRIVRDRVAGAIDDEVTFVVRDFERLG